MRDPFSWSIPLGRLFGITIRIHIFFPLIVLGLVLRAAYQKDPPLPEGASVDALVVLTLLFISVLLHEFGHCFAARRVGGDADEVLLWPLGGLASVDLPHSPRAHFVTAAAGPAVNLLLCFLSVGLLLVVHELPLKPSFNLLAYTGRDFTGQVPLGTWTGSEVRVAPFSAPALLAWLFWVNYIGFVYNMILVGYPMDAGRMLQSTLWPHLGYRQATLTAVFAGFITVFVVGVAAIVTQEVLALCLALFIYTACKQQWILLETGGEDGIFGYDFSQGYTSLEREEETIAPPRPRLSWWQRWLQRRAERKAQRELEQRVQDDQRMDELLEKINQNGIGSLTEEERRFMRRVADRKSRDRRD